MGSSVVLLAAAAVWSAGPEIAGYEGETKRVIDRSLEVYRAARTYQDRVVQKMEIETEGDSDVLAGMNQEQESRFAFTRPNRFAYESDFMSLHCDGTTFWRYSRQMGQYIAGPMPAKWSFDLDDENSLSRQGMQHPVADALLTDLPVRELYKPVKKFTRCKPMKRAGQSGHHITAEAEWASMGAVTVELWFDDASGLLREMRYDMTKTYQTLAENLPGNDEDEESKDDEKKSPPKVKRAVMIVRMEDVKLDEPIPDERFVFKPGADDEKVDAFESGDEEQEARQRELIGEAAPELKGKDLADQAVSLADFKGKVVLLDFWATWCGPCVMALPELQKLADEYAREKDVVILGVNQDSEGSTGRVAGFLEKKKITIRQMMGADEKQVEGYRLTGIPCVVLIDRKGIIQQIKSGFSPGEGQELKESIDKLLKGERLFDPQELAKEREERRKEKAQRAEEAGDREQAASGPAERGKTPVQADAQRKPTATAPGTPEEVAPDALVRQGTSRTMVSGWQSKEVDVDGDGQTELVMPSYSGRMYVLKADQETAREVRLEGMSRAGYLSDFAAVRMAEGTGWFVGAQTQAGFFRTRTRLVVSLHKPDGGQVWQYEVPAGTTEGSDIKVQAGDLDADGRNEFVVGCTWSEVSKKRSGFTVSNQHAYLFVLDDEGRLLTSRKVGESIQVLKLLGPAKAGASARILVFDNGGKRTQYHFNRAAASRPARATQPAATTKPSTTR